MRKSKRILAGILIGTLSIGALTGCGNSKGRTSVKLENGTITDNSIVIKVGDMGVKYSEVRNYCYLMKQQYEEIYSNKLWDFHLDTQTTIGDEAKEEIISMLTQLKVIQERAKEQKVELTSDEKDEALQKAEEVIGAASEKDKKGYCLTVQGLTDLYEENILANKMFYIATDAADTEVSDQEARQVKIQYIQVMTKGVNKNNTQINLTQKEKKTALEKAKELQKEAKKTKNFSDLAEQNSDSSKVELTIGQDTDQLEKTVVTAAMALKKGQVSDVIETENGYYIVYCVEENDQDATYAQKEAIIEARQTKMFKKKYKKWLGSSEVNISQSFWEKFQIS